MFPCYGLRTYSKAFGYKVASLLPDLPVGVWGLRNPDVSHAAWVQHYHMLLAQFWQSPALIACSLKHRTELLISREAWRVQLGPFQKKVISKTDHEISASALAGTNKGSKSPWSIVLNVPFLKFVGHKGKKGTCKTIVHEVFTTFACAFRNAVHDASNQGENRITQLFHLVFCCFMYVLRLRMLLWSICFRRS